jgi:site-specific DNA-methyltransferase (adenine-specific)
MIDLRHGDCLEVLKTLPDNSVDAVVTDPPYGLAFMGKRWDYDVPAVEVWAECLRVLRPGGHMLAFAGTRTQHRMAVRIEDAGFEIRDMIAWIYGSGFPKSLDVSKAIDNAAGVVREVVGPRVYADGHIQNTTCGDKPIGTFQQANGTVMETAPATPAAIQWQGWGTALKPALEPITVARKPFGGTVASNVLEHGTGALNVDGCRVQHDEPTKEAVRTAPRYSGRTMANGEMGGSQSTIASASLAGRWPANLIHDGSQEVLNLFPGEDDKSPARFFYCAKASKTDRDGGLNAMAERSAADRTERKDGSAGITAYVGARSCARNHHPTVKPTDLMRYLCRLVTPPGGVVLDPFMGSGSTGKAARLEGFRFIGIEREADYLDIARARIEGAK